MQFSQKSHVAPHERTHTGEKPHACSMCPQQECCTNAQASIKSADYFLQRFSDKAHVVPLMRTHPCEKPYGCSMCLTHMYCTAIPNNRVPSTPLLLCLPLYPTLHSPMTLHVLIFSSGSLPSATLRRTSGPSTESNAEHVRSS